MKEVVLEAGGMLGGSSAPALQTFLSRQPGIHHVEANTMSDTVTVGYDENTIIEARIRQLIEECGYHCRGEVVPRHIMRTEATEQADHAAQPPPNEHAEHAADAPKPAEHAGHAAPDKPSSSDEMAQMGHGSGMDMQAMVRDMRNRFARPGTCA